MRVSTASNINFLLILLYKTYTMDVFYISNVPLENLGERNQRLFMIYRWFEGLIKLIIYVSFIIILYMFLLGGLLRITAWVKGSCLLSNMIGENANLENDLAAYVIAAATLEFAMLTILQQHITRQQDRVLDFPDICIEKCELITSQEKILAEVIGIDEIKGQCIIKIYFKNTFPVYYIPKIHRAWIRHKKHNCGDSKIYKMKVKSSYIDKNPNNVIWYIQIDKQECIMETVTRTQIMGVQALDFIYDVSWENQLLPWLSRVLSKFYMRLTIHLEDAGIRITKGCSINVRGLEIDKAAICAPII